MLKSPKYRYHGSLLNIACYHAMYRNRSHLKQPGESKSENWMLRQLLLPCTFTARGTFFNEYLILKFWEELNKKHQDISQEWDYMYLPWTARSRVLVSIFFLVYRYLYTAILRSFTNWILHVQLHCSYILKSNAYTFLFVIHFFYTHMYTNILVSKIRKFVLVNAFI